MTKRFTIALLSVSLFMTCSSAYAAPPWARGVHDHHDKGHGYGHMKHWRRGDYYSGPREQRWMVSDWRGRRGLWAPPVGYYWMQSGEQYLLMAAATSLIAGVVAATVGSEAPTYPTAPGYASPY